jgi:hypothetical protein
VSFQTATDVLQRRLAVTHGFYSDPSAAALPCMTLLPSGLAAIPRRAVSRPRSIDSEPLFVERLFDTLEALPDRRRT